MDDDHSVWRAYRCHHCGTHMRACLDAEEPCCPGCHHGGSIRHRAFSRDT